MTNTWHILDDIPADLHDDVLLDRLHLSPQSTEAAEFRDLLQAARAVARPKALYRECYIEARGADTVTIDGILFTSRVLRTNLEAVHRVFAYVATCGTEAADVALLPDDPLQQYWLDAIKSDLLGTALDHLARHLDHRYALGKTANMHPGSGDVSVWPIEQQRPLFELLGDVQRHIGVQLTPTLLMLPNKSVSGIRFSTTVDFRTCQLCHRPDCPNRTAAFDPHLWDSIGKQP